MKEKRLIVALDVADGEDALRLVRELKDMVETFKVGMGLFTREGPEIVRRILEEGGKVFLDLKYHDIPSQVAKAMEAAKTMDVAFATVHTLGGREMMRAALEARSTHNRYNRVGCNGDNGGPLILGVTILTSIEKAVLRTELGIESTVEEEVVRLATLAREAGLAGVVASPRELKAIRQRLGKDFLIVCPGIRPSSFPARDQRRVMSPAEAIRAGADFIVVGRPILLSPDWRKTTEEIIEEIRSG